MSPRSMSSTSANTSSPSESCEQKSWMSPVPSRSVKNTSFPKRRARTTLPATATSSEVSVSGARSAYRWCSSAAVALGSKESANGSTPRSRRSSSRARRASSSSRSRPAGSSGIGGGVPLVDDAESFQREPRLVAVDRVGVRDHDRREPARRHHRRGAELLLHAVDHAFELRGGPEHDAGLDRLDRVLADRGPRREQLHLREARGGREEARSGDLEAGRDRSAKELPF